MILRASASSVSPPNSMPPRRSGLTWTPVRPKLRYSMAIDLLPEETIETPSTAPAWESARGGEVLKYRLGLLQVGRVKALGEPAVDRGEQLTGLGALALLLPQARQAHRRAQ